MSVLVSRAEVLEFLALMPEEERISLLRLFMSPLRSQRIIKIQRLVFSSLAPGQMLPEFDVTGIHLGVEPTPVRLKKEGGA